MHRARGFLYGTRLLGTVGLLLVGATGVVLARDGDDEVKGTVIAVSADGATVTVAEFGGGQVDVDLPPGIMLQVGDVIEAEGRIGNDGTLDADEIEFEDDRHDENDNHENDNRGDNQNDNADDHSGPGRGGEDDHSGPGRGGDDDGGHGRHGPG